MPSLFPIFLTLAILFAPLHCAVAEGRVALVIGNSSYKHAPILKNPVADARLLADQLKLLGFDVLLHVDLDGAAMRRAIRIYSDRLTKSGPDSIGLIFYAGHGIQVRENNYLIPIDAELRKESAAGLEAVHLADVLNTLYEAANKLNIVILDACRDNPFRKSMKAASFGLAGFEAPLGTLVSYSTSPNKVASDGVGEHSPFAIALHESLQDPNLKIEDVLKRVSERVYSSTSRKQLPWHTTSVHGDYYLARIRAPETASSASPPAGWDQAHSKLPSTSTNSPTSSTRTVNDAATDEGPISRPKSVTETIEGRIAYFIEWKFFGSDNGARRLGEDSYAETLDFYYGKASVARNEVLADKERYYKRWPNRRFSLDRETLRVDETQPGLFDVQFNFRFDVENERKHSEGNSTMALRLRRLGNDFIILAQDEIIREREITPNSPPSQQSPINHME